LNLGKRTQKTLKENRYPQILDVGKNRWTLRKKEEKNKNRKKLNDIEKNYNIK
jgi:hypothetical protein